MLLEIQFYLYSVYHPIYIETDPVERVVTGSFAARELEER